MVKVKDLSPKENSELRHIATFDSGSMYVVCEYPSFGNVYELVLKICKFY